MDVLDCAGEPSVFAAFEAVFGESHLYVREDSDALEYFPL